MNRYEGRSAADILKARGITRLVYFHSDHFEPWRYVPGRPAEHALALGDVEQYLERTAGHEFSRRATLFYKANINYAVDRSRSLWRADPADPVGFVPPDRRHAKLSADILGAIAQSHREVQIHIHHENITWNDRMRDDRMRAHLSDPAERRFDEARFELLVRLNVTMLAQHAGLDRKRWFFVHGHWALNASDPHECTLVREIEILRRNGCLGDFTQPSGRPHTDSRIDAPYLVRPVAQAKGYDRPEADPIAAAGAGQIAGDRFLIWASTISHRHASIDHYSAIVRDRMRDSRIFARHNAALGFAHDGVLYVKTHGHSMQPVYWEPDGVGGPFPHAHPGIVGELGALFDAAAAAGAEVEFATADEAFSRLLGGSPAAALPGHERLSLQDAMAQAGCDVVHRSAAGPVTTLPPLAPVRRPFGYRAYVARDPDRDAMFWPEVVSLDDPDEHGASRLAILADPAMDALAQRLAAIETRVVEARAELLAGVAEPSGQGAAEAAALAMIIEGLAPDAPIAELGCGTGLVATLLAARGRTVSGFDANAELLVTARAIAAEAEAEGICAAPPVFAEAPLVEALADWMPPRGALLIVSRIDGSQGRSGQAGIIRALGGFRIVVVDLASFLLPREGPAERAELIALFEATGFAPPATVVPTTGGARYAVFERLPRSGLRGLIDRARTRLRNGQAR